MMLRQRLGELAVGEQPITKREECQPTNRVPEDAAAFADRDDVDARPPRPALITENWVDLRSWWSLARDHVSFHARCILP
jgi:hypothetical protein